MSILPGKLEKEIFFESEFSFFEKITFSDHNKRKYVAKYKIKNDPQIRSGRTGSQSLNEDRNFSR